MQLFRRDFFFNIFNTVRLLNQSTMTSKTSLVLLVPSRYSNFRGKRFCFFFLVWKSLNLFFVFRANFWHLLSNRKSNMICRFSFSNPCTNLVTRSFRSDIPFCLVQSYKNCREFISCGHRSAGIIVSSPTTSGPTIFMRSFQLLPCIRLALSLFCYLRYKLDVVVLPELPKILDYLLRFVEKPNSTLCFLAPVVQISWHLWFCWFVCKALSSPTHFVIQI